MFHQSCTLTWKDCHIIQDGVCLLAVHSNCKPKNLLDRIAASLQLRYCRLNISHIKLGKETGRVSLVDAKNRRRIIFDLVKVVKYASVASSQIGRASCRERV